MKTRVMITTMGLLAGSAAFGSLLVYENFNFGAANGAAIDGLSGSGSVGLGGSWGSVGAGTSSATYAASGLSFSGIGASGGALLVSSGSTDGAVNAFRQVTTGVPMGSTLYGSFLFRTSAAGSQYVSVLGVETGAGTNFGGGPITAHRLGDNDDPFRFTVNADTFNGSTTGTNGIKVRRYNSNGSIANAAGSGNLANDVTYLAVFAIAPAYEGDGSSGLVAQSASVWILNESQFGALDLGSLTEASLDAGNVSKATLGTPGFQGGMEPGYFLNIAALAAGASGANATLYDEVRIGTTLDAVVVPEPSTIAVVFGLLALGACALRRRK